jgi:hypothetical protein
LRLSFDEAKTLLKDDLFLAIRTAHNAIHSCLELGTRPSFFALFLATDSSLANFLPPNFDDPSLRGKLAALQLYHPIYKIPSSDVYARLDNVYDFSQEVITSSRHYIKFGRPSWFVRTWKLGGCLLGVYRLCRKQAYVSETY